MPDLLAKTEAFTNETHLTVILLERWKRSPACVKFLLLKISHYLFLYLSNAQCFN